MSIRWCKENANIRICSMIFLLAKMRDPRDFGFNYAGCMWGGVVSTRISHYLHIRFFINLVSA